LWALVNVYLHFYSSLLDEVRYLACSSRHLKTLGKAAIQYPWKIKMRTQ